MANGEWEVKLKNGKSISGISMCSITQGSNRKDGEYDLKNNIDTSGTGFNCWCKITHTELTECIKTQQFPWVFVEEFWQISDNDLQNDDNPALPAKYFTRGANNCSWSCAQECGYKFFDYNSYIILQSHGVEYIQDYYTKK